ncbi:TRAP transporter large permease subunit [Ramlibacter humi]|uniref:TRAP transporter large permease subunit n=1 Tax=Ramlibacter humi TaxID=2530451 RepID=A0A4Z0C9Q7_9BURK|nr:TRAP transporter large permease subunit [Ramlibacter humi]TFZ08396.1 TRAP transporter large permease subunit [Ramlibacter humi]
MNTAGLWMLVALGVLVATTGLPVWALLIGVASAAAAVGLAAGVFDTNVLAALPTRIVNLLEHDLLQAMPLYVFVGLLLARLPAADALYRTFAHALRRTGAGEPLAALATGAVIAPMNGSVAASSALLARLAGRRQAGGDASGRVALAAASATLGVVVPPSLVLILLGDAMLRAHTEASNLPGYKLGAERIVNTQDVFNAALLPGLAVLLLWALAAWWGARRLPKTQAPSPSRGDVALTVFVVAGIAALLGGVLAGRLFAVEAAAAGACLLAAATLALRALPWAAWREVLNDTLALSGALFALLAGATTFSLVLRLFGTDRWLAGLVLHSPWPAHVTAAVVLAAVLACAWVLDAFEMIFVVVPVVAPLLVVELGDARQVAVLLLLALQLGFLLPPLGYAVLMTRGLSAQHVGTRPLLRAIAPYAAVQLLVTVLVFAWPASVHFLGDAPPAPGTTPAESEDDLVQRMREMSPAETPDAPEPAAPR